MIAHADLYILVVTSYRLRIALAYKRLDYTPHYVSLPKMEHRTPSYQALHAQGLVPLLIDGDGPDQDRWPSSSIWTRSIRNRR